MLELLRSSDVFLLPSLTEGMPVSVIEAMACGTAIVATAVGGTPELVGDDISGILVKPADPAAIAYALTRVLRDTDLRRRLGEAARSTYEQGRWTPKSTADATLTAYRHARNESPARFEYAQRQVADTTQ